MDNLSGFVRKLCKKHWLPLSLGILGLIFLVYGLIGLFNTYSSSDQIKFETNSAKDSNLSENLIYVDIEGEVVRPGVYKLKQDSIVQDVFVASGGLTANADRDWVARNINLALKLSEGQKIYIPKIGEDGKTMTTSVLSSSTSNTGLININSASEKELDSLPGVGPVTAAKIINSRPYAAIEELEMNKIVSSKVYLQIKDKIAVW